MNVFCRWQTLIGATLLVLFGKLGWVEISRISRYYIDLKHLYRLSYFSQNMQKSVSFFFTNSGSNDVF